MGQYISKDALLTWAKETYLCENVSNIRKVCYKQLLNFLNTLKVKEVDLQSEIDRVWDNTSDNFSEDCWKEFEDIAKHFFKLGLLAQKEE